MADPIVDGNEPALSFTYPTPSYQGRPHGARTHLASQDFPFTMRVKNKITNAANFEIIVRPFGPYTVGDTSPVTGVVNVAVPITVDATGTIVSFSLTFDSNASGSYFFYGYNKSLQKQVGRGIGVINFV